MKAFLISTSTVSAVSGFTLTYDAFTRGSYIEGVVGGALSLATAAFAVFVYRLDI